MILKTKKMNEKTGKKRFWRGSKSWKNESRS